jgi:Septum formation
MSGFLRGWGIRILIILAIGAGAFVLRDRLSSSAGDLAVGDCFAVPTTAVEVSEVQHSPCNESHTGEVVFVGDMPDGETFPTDAAFDDFLRTQCVPAFNTYTGLNFETDQTFDFSSFTPTTEGWSSGDREVTCFLVRVDGGAMTSSMKATP